MGHDDSDAGLSSDPDSLDDDVLRSVDAFSSDEEDDKLSLPRVDLSKQNLLETRSIRDRARSVASIMKLSDADESILT